MDGQHTTTMMIENELLFKDSIRVYVVNGTLRGAWIEMKRARNFLSRTVYNFPGGKIRAGKTGRNLIFRPSRVYECVMETCNYSLRDRDREEKCSLLFTIIYQSILQF